MNYLVRVLVSIGTYQESKCTNCVLVTRTKYLTGRYLGANNLREKKINFDLQFQSTKARNTGQNFSSYWSEHVLELIHIL